MSGYLVTIWHHKPVYRNGDLESDILKETESTFKTRREAKAYIESRLDRLKNVKRWYHRGNTTSTCVGWTGKVWTNENTGEECEEHYKFYLQKE